MADVHRTTDHRAEILAWLNEQESLPERTYSYVPAEPIRRMVVAIRLEVEHHGDPDDWAICGLCAQPLPCDAIQRIHSALFPTPLQKEPVMP
jgi:hypothetical protein